MINRLIFPFYLLSPPTPFSKISTAKGRYPYNYPGVYMFWASMTGQIYIGQSLNMKNRLRSYANPRNDDLTSIVPYLTSAPDHVYWGVIYDLHPIFVKYKITDVYTRTRIALYF